MKTIVRAIALAAFAAAAGVAPAGAQIINTYTNAGVFQAAVGPVTVETFTTGYHFPLGSTLNSTSSYPTNGINPGDIQAGVTYSVPSGPLLIDAGAGFTGGFLDAAHAYYGSANPLTATFDGPVSAFGFLYNGFGGNQHVIIHAQSGDYSYFTNPPLFDYQNVYFLGFQSASQEILSVSFDSGEDYFAAFDDFQWSTEDRVDPTPEPASLVLVATGLLGVVAARRRKKA